MYETLVNPFTVIIAFALILICLDFFKPQVSRIILGIFFLVMALGVNLPIILSDPTLFVAAGANALLPVYRWFFTTVLAWNPVVFAVPLMLIEISIGLLILSRGRYARLGLMGGALFCLLITPVGIEEITSPLLAVALGLLLRKNFERSPIEPILDRFQRKPAISSQTS